MYPGWVRETLAEMSKGDRTSGESDVPPEELKSGKEDTTFVNEFLLRIETGLHVCGLYFKSYPACSQAIMPPSTL